MPAARRAPCGISWRPIRPSSPWRSGLAVAGKTGGIGALGAALWFWARVAYLPLYLFGVSYIRTLAFVVATIGLDPHADRLSSA